MPDTPDDLLRELEATQPALVRLAELPAAGETRSRNAERDRPSTVQHRGGLIRRLRDWLARRLDRNALTTWFTRRFVPWLEENTKRSTIAGKTFWNELTPDERELLREFLSDVRRNPKDAVTSRDQIEVAEIVLFVRRALTAAKEAWGDGERAPRDVTE